MDMMGKVRRMKLRDGLIHSEIARRTGLSRNTVKKWLKAASDIEPKYKLAEQIRRHKPKRCYGMSAPGDTRPRRALSKGSGRPS